MSIPSRRELDLALLAAGDQWWDDQGSPAPWPEDFFDPDTDWRPPTHTPPNLATGEQPF